MANNVNLALDEIIKSQKSKNRNGGGARNVGKRSGGFVRNGGGGGRREKLFSNVSDCLSKGRN